MKSAVDNIAIQAIEDVLIADLGNLLSPSLVMQMEQELVHAIAAESQESQDRRLQLSRTLDILQSGLTICKRHVG